MSAFNKFERDIARTLEKFPIFRVAVKEFYKRLAYWLYREPGFKYKLHPKAALITPQKWSGMPESKGEWFFGYYDKSPWSSDMKRAVFHRYDGKKVAIMVVDQEDGKQYSVGTSDTWNFQQGSMAQWFSGDGSNTVVYNVVKEGTLGCIMVKCTGDVGRFIPWPIQALHPNGHEALTLNYKRLSLLRPDYGYSVKAKNFSITQDIDKDGIWRVDLDKGSATLIISIADLSYRKPTIEMRDTQHKVNHLIFSPSGSKFVFLHRFIGANGKFSRLYVGDSDGGNLRLLMDHRLVSHYHWKDNTHLLVWGRMKDKGDHYYLVNVDTGETKIIGKGILDKYGDGHCSFSPDRRWILTDTYPDRARLQRLLLFDAVSGECTTVGQFFSPWSFVGKSRCDLHPRWSPDGKWISIDSAHEGLRRTYFIDVGFLKEEYPTCRK